MGNCSIQTRASGPCSELKVVSGWQCASKNSFWTLQKQVVDASNVLFGSPGLYTSTSSAFYEYYNLKPGTAAILAMKDHDASAPAALYSISHAATPKEKQALVDWVGRSS